MSIFGIFFMMPALQIWPCHVTQEANFEKIYFFPNSAFKIRKSYKISNGKAPYFRSYQPKTSRGMENTPPVLLGLKDKIDLSVIPETLTDGAKYMAGGLLVFL